jgi:hypothetical protein
VKIGKIRSKHSWHVKGTEKNRKTEIRLNLPII